MTERRGFEGDDRVLDELRNIAKHLDDPDNRYTVEVRSTDNPDLAEGAISHAINRGRFEVNGEVNVRIGGKEDTGKRRRSSDK